jgi:hypothetical protein
MKRSEMVKQIKSIIATCGPTQPTIKTAKQVLKACEDAGMLPPVVEGIVKVETDGEQLVVRPWRWESER